MNITYYGAAVGNVVAKATARAALRTALASRMSMRLRGAEVSDRHGGVLIVLCRERPMTARAARRIRGAAEAIEARVRRAARASGEQPRVVVVIGRGLGYDEHFICDVGGVP